MEIGTCKWFSKGYGFIDHNGQDVFVHFKDIDMPGYKKLDEGDGVMFDIITDSKGMKAINVRVLTPTPNCS